MRYYGFELSANSEEIKENAKSNSDTMDTTMYSNLSTRICIRI